jgi:uncharacterized protein YdhG (YjbR/CyaY superfamily)
MRNYKAADVDEYIASAEPEARPVLEELRKIIKSSVPDANEGISWGVPFYKYKGLLAGFSVFTSHVSFGLAFVIQDEDRKKLGEKGYTTGKKTIQIKFNQKVPAEAITQLIKTKAKLNEAKKKA